MPARGKEKYPDCTEMRKVSCYVQAAQKRQVWISVDEVPWLVRLLREQSALGGVPLLKAEHCEEGDSAPALAGGQQEGQRFRGTPLRPLGERRGDS